MKEEIKYVLQNIRHRKLRSGLSILSILIGITAIYALLSFGFGIQTYIDTLASESGADKLFIQARSIGAPGTDEAFFISKEDIDFVRKIRGVNDIAGLYAKPVEIESRDKKKFNFAYGFDTKDIKIVEESFTLKVAAGRTLKNSELDKVVLGYNYQLPEKIFEKELVVGDKITINGKQFEAIGFYDELGNPVDDASIYMTKEAMEELNPDVKDRFAFAMIRADKGVDPTELAAIVKERLRKHNNQEEGEESFYVQSFEDALATFSAVISIINSVLVMIAVISMIVAFVNIMNTMYTAVLERTKEIGIMKSIGARNSFIKRIFVLEAGVLGFIGGIIGVLLGYLIASAGGAAAAAGGFALLKPSFPLWLGIGCILFATVVGATSGYFPARHAARLKPVDA
ncbi:MAG TPA: ABC transporter permease, partial [Candidatus Nanoarchaeia archaeon]|nr:ABC transporter permease [Candidatus Nanoarchaeia archaeon]